MRGQSRTWSLIEAWTNVLVGLGVAILANVIVLGSMGHHLSFKENAMLAGIMTVISVVRSYCLRRAFNWWHHR